VVDEDDREAFDVVAEPFELGVEVLDGAGVFDEVEVGEVVEAVEDDEPVAVVADLPFDRGEVVGEREAGVEVERDFGSRPASSFAAAYAWIRFSSWGRESSAQK
jgi:hypothetical protein